jgi:hypothetical protein
VGPPGAAPTRDSGPPVLTDRDEQPDAGRDEQLRREVPPHHGG